MNISDAGIAGLAMPVAEQARLPGEAAAPVL